MREARNPVPYRRLAMAAYCAAGGSCRFPAAHRGWCRLHAVGHAMVKLAAWLRSL